MAIDVLLLPRAPAQSGSSATLTTCLGPGIEWALNKHDWLSEKARVLSTLLPFALCFDLSYHQWVTG